MGLRNLKSPDLSKIERAIDSSEEFLDSGLTTIKGKKYSDIGRGIVVPTRDVVRGVQRLHEAKMPLFERIAQVSSMIAMALCIIIIFLLVRY